MGLDVAWVSRRGENVGLILDNHPEWLFSELGAQSLGRCGPSLYLSRGQRAGLTGSTAFEAAYVFAQDQEQVDKLLACRDELAHVRHAHLYRSHRHEDLQG